MARLFDDAASQYLEYAGAVVSAVPLTMACWVKSDDDAKSQWLMSVGRSAADTDIFGINIRGDVAGDYARASANQLGSWGEAVSTVGYSAGVWVHVCGVFASATDRSIYVGGTGKGTNSTNLTPASPDVTGIGRLSRMTPTGYTSGRIAWPCIWNVALSDAEVAALAAGAFPPSIRPASIVDLWDLTRNVDPETPWVGSHNLTVSGATYSSDDPPVAMPGYVYRANQ